MVNFFSVVCVLCFVSVLSANVADKRPPNPALKVSSQFVKPSPVTMEQLAQMKTQGVSVVEVNDYVFGSYKGSLTCPPNADINPKRAFIIFWKNFPYRFVFSHEGSYCPWFEFPSGAGVSYQFFEGNLGYAELFNAPGRMEKNSFMDVLEWGPKRVWVRWTYFGVNMESGQPMYRGTEDFWGYPNGLVLRRQTYESLNPERHEGYTREPIELIGMCPPGKLWLDVLQRDAATDECHALAVLDTFSDKRYDVYWKHKPGTLRDCTYRRNASLKDWEQLDNAAGVALVMPLKEGFTFCIFGDASGFRHDYTRLKEHTFADTNPDTDSGWQSGCWDHWPIGWLNSQGHWVDANSLRLYPNHFSTMGMDFYALVNQESQRGAYYSLLGVETGDIEQIRKLGKDWLKKSENSLKADMDEKVLNYTASLRKK